MRCFFNIVVRCVFKSSFLYNLYFFNWSNEVIFLSLTYEMPNGYLTYKECKTLDDKKYIAIESGKDIGGILCIPSHINNIPVTIIEYDAFASNPDLVSVKMPDTITTIGSGAFGSCTSLKSVIFSKNLKYIEYAAFAGCLALNNVEIPGGVTEIGKDAFGECISLANVTFNEGLITILDKAFYKCPIEKLKFPNSLVRICERAFETTDVETVECGEELTEIGDYAFAECLKLTDIKFNKKLKTIGHKAFLDCSSLKSFILPDNVEFLGYESLDSCSSLETIHFGKKTDIGMNDRRDFAFNSNNLEKITISPGNKKLVVIDGVLYDRESNLLIKACPRSPIKSITVPEWVKSTTFFSFNGAYSLKSINFKCPNIRNIGRSGLAELDNTSVRCLLGSELESWCIKVGMNLKRQSELDKFLSSVDTSKVSR